MISLQNKTVLITGASKGIGRALALRLAKEGVRLGLVARSAAELESLRSEILSLGGLCLIFPGSVAEESLAEQATAEICTKWGPLHYLINNAGFGLFGKVDEFSAGQWSDLYDTNVKGTFLFSRAALEPMKAAGSGHIVNVASDVARRVFEGGALYCSSKYAQDAFSMALRKEVRKHGIKVSVIYSGLVDTHFHAEPQGDASHTDWLTAEDMADAIMYVMRQPAHVVIDELMIHPLSQAY